MPGQIKEFSFICALRLFMRCFSQEENPRASLMFYWQPLIKMVRLNISIFRSDCDIFSLCIAFLLWITLTLLISPQNANSVDVTSRSAESKPWLVDCVCSLITFFMCKLLMFYFSDKFLLLSVIWHCQYIITYASGLYNTALAVSESSTVKHRGNTD